MKSSFASSPCEISSASIEQPQSTYHVEILCSLGKELSKCGVCGAEVELPFQCNFCGKYFCEAHRLPENHGCLNAPSALKMLCFLGGLSISIICVVVLLYIQSYSPIGTLTLFDYLLGYLIPPTVIYVLFYVLFRKRFDTVWYWIGAAIPILAMIAISIIFSPIGTNPV